MRLVVGTDCYDKFIKASLAFSIGSLSFVPAASDVVALLLVFTLAIYCAAILAGRPRWSINGYGLFAIIFVFYLLFANSLVSLYFDKSFEVFFRGVVPYLFLICFVLFWNDAKLTGSAAYSLAWMATIVWLLKLVVFNAESIYDVFAGNLARLSYVVSDVLIPFGLIGFVLTLYKEGLGKVIRLPLLIAFGVIVVISGFRSQFLMILAVLLFYLRVWKSLLGVGLALALFMFVGALYIVDFPVIDVLVNRMSGSSGDSVRSAELDFAMSKFYESPILGLGFTVPVPVEVTRPDHMMNYFERDAVPYIHNILGYFMMNTGGVGAASVLILLGWPLFVSAKYWLEGDKKQNEGVFVVLSLLIAFFLVSASFRQIQTVLVFLLLACSLFKRNREGREEYEV